MTNLVADASLGALIGTSVAFLIIKFFLPSYLDQKGKNLATREDIAEITREVERVRHEYSSLLEDLKAKHQLRFAALDRRLQAHQEAFDLWRGLVTSPDQASSGILECQTWWEKNCLYLEPQVRQAFVEAYTNAHLRAEFVRVGTESKLITAAWDKVMAFPNILFAAIKLPPLTEAEAKGLQTSDG